MSAVAGLACVRPLNSEVHPIVSKLGAAGGSVRADAISTPRGERFPRNVLHGLLGPLILCLQKSPVPREANFLPLTSNIMRGDVLITEEYVNGQMLWARSTWLSAVLCIVWRWSWLEVMPLHSRRFNWAVKGSMTREHRQSGVTDVESESQLDGCQCPLKGCDYRDSNPTA